MLEKGKCLLLLLACVFALSACGGEAPVASGPELTAAQVGQAILDSQEDTEGLEALEGETLSAYLTACGLSGWEDGAVWAADGMDSREIVVVLMPGPEDAETAAQALEEHRQDRHGDFYGYAPDQARLVSQGMTATYGGYAALLICADPDGAREALKEVFQGGTLHTAAPSPTLDTSGFLPFKPPNKVDMTLYDSRAVLEAWESGEEGGLSEEDGIILERCREVLGELLREDMTEFEKELAVYDWLVEWGTYDDLSRNREDHRGRPHNSDPYGMLTEGYGICLGYATTFQLLMDVAGVECITVVGASKENREDHAWNMVKLDGEWYCVDVTWSDPAGDMSGQPEWFVRELHYRYFNVTSDYMRQTNHQWDYQNVPEAAAAAYRWDGTGDIPVPKG